MRINVEELREATGEDATRVAAAHAAAQLLQQARLLAAKGEREKAIELFEKALALYREVKDQGGEGVTLDNLGRVYRSLSQYEKAIGYSEQALVIHREVKDRSGEGFSLNNLGLAHWSLSQYEKAIGYHEQALAIQREVKDRPGEGTTRRASRQRYPVVHIASHFLFRPGDETRSFLLLGDGTQLTLSQIKAFPGLFGGVQLLTLSACNTGLGDNNADGREVEGFGVLAQRNGAKAVVASLWPVADRSTSVLMQDFYRRRASNPRVPKAEALRLAQLSFLRGSIKLPRDAQPRRVIVLESGRDDAVTFRPSGEAPFAHPYYWAPFFLMGNWL